MLVQIGRFGEGGQRIALAADRRQQQHLGVTCLSGGEEHGRVSQSSNGLRKNDVAGGQIDLDVFLGEVEIHHAVALVRIERGLLDLPRQVGGSGRLDQTNTQKQQQDGETGHTSV